MGYAEKAGRIWVSLFADSSFNILLVLKKPGAGEQVREKSIQMLISVAHCTPPFHTGDLSIWGFWSPQGSRNQSTAGAKGWLCSGKNCPLELGTIRPLSPLLPNIDLFNFGLWLTSCRSLSWQNFHLSYFLWVIIIWRIHFFLAGLNSPIFFFFSFFLCHGSTSSAFLLASCSTLFKQNVLNILWRTLWENLMLRKKRCNASIQLPCKQISPHNHIYYSHKI